MLARSKSTHRRRVSLEDTQSPVKRFVYRNLRSLTGLIVLVLSLASAVALATWNVTDPSFSHVTETPAQNALGKSGAILADILMQSLGLAAAFALLPVIYWGWRLFWTSALPLTKGRFISWLIAILASAGAFAALPLTQNWPLPTGLGGFMGDWVFSVPNTMLGGLTEGIRTLTGVLLLGVPALALLANASGYFASQSEPQDTYDPAAYEADEEDDGDEDSRLSATIGAISHWKLMALAAVKRLIQRKKSEPNYAPIDDYGYDDPEETYQSQEQSSHQRKIYVSQPDLDQYPAENEQNEDDYAAQHYEYEEDSQAHKPGLLVRVKSFALSKFKGQQPDDGLDKFYEDAATNYHSAAQQQAASPYPTAQEPAPWSPDYEGAPISADEAHYNDEAVEFTDAGYAAAQDGFARPEPVHHHAEEPEMQIDAYPEDYETQSAASRAHPTKAPDAFEADANSLVEPVAPTDFAEEDFSKGNDNMLDFVPQRTVEPQRTGKPHSALRPVGIAQPPQAANDSGPTAPASTPVQPQRRAPARPSLVHPPREFEKPPLALLKQAEDMGKFRLSNDALEQNARILEGVLEDFGVRGEIIAVRPGPVVTLYELEPAPGIKSSRVIGLADDIARSMSAISARVAVIPGKNAIGIELPNARRETVYLRELLSCRDFQQSKAGLALTLGKTINGEAVIADLARMPHLLVAGTTGSGKSVSVNTMILSLLYRLTPEECKLIMIDPKMLELSIYDGIPHLLTPVVTDPNKAVVALKWTVREMEDRYKKMSKVGVRNIDGYNTRVSEAAQKGERFTRTIQTGFDKHSGEPIFEEEELPLEKMPYIVVVVDEMADLMMVAGKDIEGAIQRLAQMARAAGIHLIMATQRPSVDVITGTIKANFPTRISFQVTSKIDSRTILGEMGAEQLLGMGDMLYMAGGGKTKRVHGPFVSDDEVEMIVNHLKEQGTPQYLAEVTEGGDEGGSYDALSQGSGNASADLFDQAVAIVARDRKASTSYIQRRLSIGYNRAASLIERMEQEGMIGPANHAGKREILLPEAGEEF
ncbi:DNA translocase FtsK [Polycladidibacter hongkongensis]|uniref:DNA translocase FtsK n=1 Tax=Polycladidibacter hongkongensis TaxID=1647556 RepID=UPI00082C47A5|nr:DNA translocase FtsK [Pseudovibrio hongkongensis]